MLKSYVSFEKESADKANNQFLLLKFFLYVSVFRLKVHIAVNYLHFISFDTVWTVLIMLQIQLINQTWQLF